MTLIHDGARVFGFLSDEIPRANERPLRFGGAEDAARFLERVGASGHGARVLRELLGDGFAAARLRDAEVPRILAPRLASGEIRVVEVLQRPRLTLGMHEYVLLDRTEPPRRGETVRAFFSVEQAESFLQRMSDDPGRRHPLTRETVRDLAARLVAGRVRLALCGSV